GASGVGRCFLAQVVNSIRKRPGPFAPSHLWREPAVRLARRRKGIRDVNQDQIWSQVQEELRFQLAKRTYDMWLKNTSVVSADGGTFRIGVPSKLAKDWLEDRFSGLIQETLQAVTGSEVDIDFVIAPSGHRPAHPCFDADDDHAADPRHA